MAPKIRKVIPVLGAPAVATPDIPFVLFPGMSDWEPLAIDAAEGLEGDKLKEREESIRRSAGKLRNSLMDSLQMQHVLVLVGSGASMSAGGPSMWTLWCAAIGEVASAEAKAVAVRLDYDLSADANKNIERFMSAMESYLQVHPGEEHVGKLLDHCKRVILHRCSSFLGENVPTGHRTFLHRLSRRRSRDERLRVFTTNYDRCFEVAASALGCVVLDGFSFTAPRQYDPRYFGYDIVRRPDANTSNASYLEGVFILHKLHGSVDWARDSRDSSITQKAHPKSDEACLVYPARGKFQQSFMQPYLESLSQFLTALRQPNTCLLVLGFGFNDDHLSEPVLSAVRSNPHLRMVVVDSKAKVHIGESTNTYWHDFGELCRKGYDIHFVAEGFDPFVNRLPDLKALTPPERLYKAVKDLAGGHE